MEADAQVMSLSNTNHICSHLQAAASRIDKSLNKDEALSHAFAAIEIYMDVIKLHSQESEKSRLRIKCNALLQRAEEIKKTAYWQPSTSSAAFLKVPLSTRPISTREQIILLEGSKLHGFVFPPWKTEPDDVVFEEVPLGKSHYT